ncbi:transposase family protein [Streptomyces canus]|uniref:transposase family protein n=1 Tax=Streptomyces canus TaxID=58343 RepID=UPI0021F123F3|nr:transposase family protein [Streptomyces canus]
MEWWRTSTEGVGNRPSAPTWVSVNRALSRARAPVERGIARLKPWRILRRSRYSPNRMTSIAATVLTPERQR